MKSAALQAQINRNRAPESFGTNGAQPIRVTLSPSSQPIDFGTFQKTGQMTFAIAIDDPAFQVGFAEITLKEPLKNSPSRIQCG
jgi:hypothetical protein